jgi:3-phenylpropionate/trans-cinnamate dioxygenase ferredoxin reductase subunit
VSARHVDHLLIGGGVASATCAATLREEGAAGSVLVVGRELDPPYHRPPITKGILRGTSSRQDALVHPAGWWAQHDVELLTRTTVTALDPVARTAALSTGETVSFGNALVATGATVRRLDIEGTDLDGSTTCARPATPSRCAVTSPAPGASSASAVPTSAARSPRR